MASPAASRTWTVKEAVPAVGVPLRAPPGLRLRPAGRFAEAIADYSHAIRLKPAFFEAYLDRARACEALSPPTSIPAVPAARKGARCAFV